MTSSSSNSQSRLEAKRALEEEFPSSDDSPKKKKEYQSKLLIQNPKTLLVFRWSYLIHKMMMNWNLRS